MMAQPVTTVFYHWWVEQLTQLVPANWLNLLAKSTDAAILEMRGDYFSLRIRRDGHEAQLDRGSLRDVRASLETVSDRPQLLLLRIAPELALCKHLSLPSAARRDLKSLLGFEIDRETPFEQGEVYWDYAITAQDKERAKLDVDLVVVPRALADGAIAAVRAAGCEPAALEIEITPGKFQLIWIVAQRPVRQILPYRKFVPLAVVTAGLAAAFIILSFAGQQWSLFIANQTIARLQDQAHEASALRQAANNRLAAIGFFGRGNGNGALSVLAAATRALPDDTYLTSLGVHDGRVNMAGYSESAASLIGLLQKSPSFRDPVFDSPLTEAEGSDEEKFTISMSLVPAVAS
jgi:general secretion pathway protein L